MWLGVINMFFFFSFKIMITMPLFTFSFFFSTVNGFQFISSLTVNFKLFLRLTVLNFLPPLRPIV